MASSLVLPLAPASLSFTSSRPSVARALSQGPQKWGLCSSRDHSVSMSSSQSALLLGRRLPGVASIGIRKRQSGAAAGTVAVLKESTSLEKGTHAPTFELPEPLTGRTVSLDDFDAHPALLVMFSCVHCPFVKHLKPAIKELTDEYMAKGLGVVAISSNSIKTHPQDGPEEIAKECKDLDYNFSYLYDETQEVAKAYKAACTPEFYVFKKDGRRPFELAYHGQFDSSRPSTGMPVTGKDLREALDCILSGRPITFRQKPSVGCNIKWHPGCEPEYF